MAAGLMGLGVVIVAGGVAGSAAFVLLGCVVIGAGLTHLSGLPLTLEERVAYGTVIGSLVVSVLGLLIALLFGLALATVVAALLLGLGLSAAGWWRGRGSVRGEVDDLVARWGRLEPWPLWLLLAAAWPFTVALLSHAYLFTSQGLVVGGAAFYADWAAHLTYAGSFAYGHNFPPEFPMDPGHRMAYPFLIDFLAASLVPLGASLTWALVLTSGLLGLAFPAVMYLAVLRLAGSRAAAALAVLVFALSGGLGFALLAPDFQRQGLAILFHLPRYATQDPGLNVQWLNPVLAWLLPQRSVLFGYSLAMFVMAMLWLALHDDRGRSRVPFAFAGVVTGLAPLAHLHGYGTIIALSGFWAIVSPRRSWLAFFAPAVAIGAPVVLWTLAGGAASVRMQLWWLANTSGHADGPVWFWLKNTGVLVPVMAVAFAWPRLLPSRLGLHLAPIWLWFLIPNVIVFQPWDWDNTKFFAYWLLFGSVPVGVLLARLFRLGPASAILAGALATLLMLSGALDLVRSLDRRANDALFTDAAGVQTAAWVRDHTDRRAIFLVSPDHNEPIPTLAGRRVMDGYPGWLWTYGLPDWSSRSEDAERMLRGAPTTPDLIRKYDVGYVVLGPAEITGHSANVDYWNEIAERVYTNGTYAVYRVR